LTRVDPSRIRIGIRSFGEYLSPALTLRAGNH
jgi:hypothetical protein